MTKSDRQRGGGGGLMYGSNAFIAVVTIQPRPQGLLSIQNGGRAAEKTLGSRLVTITGATLDGLNVNERLSIPIDEMTFQLISCSQRLKQDHRARFTSSGMQGVIEHGVLFHRTPGSAAEQKKTPPVLKYWVIGYVE